MASKVTDILIYAQDKASSVSASLNKAVKGVVTAIADFLGIDALGGVVKGAENLEETMGKVQVTTGASADEMARLGKAAEEASASSSEALESITEAASAAAKATAEAASAEAKRRADNAAAASAAVEAAVKAAAEKEAADAAAAKAAAEEAAVQKAAADAAVKAVKAAKDAEKAEAEKAEKEKAQKEKEQKEKEAKEAAEKPAADKAKAAKEKAEKKAAEKEKAAEEAAEKAAETAADKLAMQYTMSAQYTARQIKLLELEAEAYRKKWNMDKEGYSLNTAGQPVMAGEIEKDVSDDVANLYGEQNRNNAKARRARQLRALARLRSKGNGLVTQIDLNADERRELQALEYELFNTAPAKPENSDGKTGAGTPAAGGKDVKGGSTRPVERGISTGLNTTVVFNLQSGVKSMTTTLNGATVLKSVLEELTNGKGTSR